VLREESSEIEMQRVNEYRFYELGQKVRAISSIQEEWLFEDHWYPLWEVRVALRQLKEDVVAFRISLSAVDRVIAAIDSIVPDDIPAVIEKLKVADGHEKPVIGWAHHELTESLKHFEPVLAAECLALDTYVVSQKRGYSTPDLIERSDVMLSQDTRGTVAGGVIADIRAAGRCLAFDVPTAAGFHMLRAVEAVMASYYKHITGKELPKRNRNWGLYLKKVKDAPAHDPKVYGALDHIRENYRNPISHPEDTLDEGSAIMLFALSLSVIELMAESLRTTTPALPEIEELQALTAIAEQRAASEPPDDF
jgi:hypothetical protein